MAEEALVEGPLHSLSYRLGQIEARVSALEDSTREIKNMLSTITTQLSTIQITVSSFLGKREGTEKALGSVGYIINILIAALTALIIAHFGK